MRSIRVLLLGDRQHADQMAVRLGRARESFIVDSACSAREATNSISPADHLDCAVIQDDADDVNAAGILESLRADHPGLPVVLFDTMHDESTATELENRIAAAVNSDRAEREHVLAALHEATRQLVRAETKKAICEIAVETVHDVLDMPITGFWLWKERSETLEVTASTEPARRLLDEPFPTFKEGNSLTWEAFALEEMRSYDDVSQVDGVHNENTVIRSELIVPVGDHGVINIGSSKPKEFDDTDRYFVRILTANVEAAFARAEREALLREREQELVRQNDRLDEFASVLAHDLRNPLNVACGGLELYRESADSTHLKRVERAHERIDTLIEDVLNLTRKGRTVDDTESVDVFRVAMDAWTTVRSDGTILHANGGLSVQADASRLTQLFENVFANAVEHGDANVITVGECESGFYVADDGCGISASDREHAFKPGYTTADDGTGFGLTIVDGITQAHDWEVRLTESEDGGARFEFVL